MRKPSTAFYFNWTALFLVLLFTRCQSSPAAKIVQRLSLPQTVTILVHMGAMEMAYFNYRDSLLNPQVLAFRNPVRKDSLIEKTAVLTRPTHFYYSLMYTDDAGKIRHVERDLLAFPSDTLELTSLQTDIAFSGRSVNRKFLSDVLRIDRRVAPYMLKQLGGDLERYNHYYDTLYMENIKRIEAAFANKQITRKDKEAFLAFNDLYTASQFMAPLGKDNYYGAGLNYQQVNYKFLDQHPSVFHQLYSWFYSPLLEGLATYKTLQRGQEERGLSSLQHLDKAALGDLYNAFVLQCIIAQPRKNDPILHRFIDSFATAIQGTSFKPLIDSIRRLYTAPVDGIVEKGQTAGALVDLQGRENNFTTLLNNSKDSLVVVDFWASWCGPCRRQMPAMHRIISQFKRKPIRFLAVSIDVEERADDWRSASRAEAIEERNSYRLKGGNFNHLLHYYGIEEVPRYLVFAKDGKLVSDRFAEPTSSAFTSELTKLLNE